MKSNEPMAGREKTCPECGRIFWARPDWAYKYGYEGKAKKYLCSWKCLRAARGDRDKCRRYTDAEE